MMKLVPLALALSLGGCAEFDNAVRDINSAPTQQALATLKTVATALICDVSSGSALALAVESQIAGIPKAQATTNKVYVTSALVCQKLSGTVVAQARNVVAVSAVATP